MFRNTIWLISLALAAVLAMSTATYAWNIICGISIGLAVKTDARKWDADSHALRGIGLYYLGVAELQRLSLDNGKLTDPMSLDKTTLATSKAAELLASSGEEFEKATELAKELKLGDDKGLQLLESMKSGVDTAVTEITKSRTLPELDQLQSIAESAIAYTRHGIDLSKKHLEMKIEGHDAGGAKYKIE